MEEMRMIGVNHHLMLLDAFPFPVSLSLIEGSVILFNQGGV